MEYEENQLALPRGYVLGDKYEVEKLLGAGGFGLTYAARHTTMHGRRFAIKEFLLSGQATRVHDSKVVPIAESNRDDYAWGLNAFLTEAQILADISHANHPNVVRVDDYFEANNTAYIVMEFIDGVELRQLFDEKGPLQVEVWRPYLNQILSGLQLFHKMDPPRLHRDIKPDNILLRRSNASPVLIDFGAAREVTKSANNLSRAVVTTGYSPIEQWGDRNTQGPWTDIYALGALSYQALFGVIPTDAISRSTGGKLTPATKLGTEKASMAFYRAVDWALMIRPEQRPRSLDEWIEALEGRREVPGFVGSGRQETLVESEEDEETEWARVEAEGTISAYDKFAEKYSSSRFAVIARDRSDWGMAIHRDSARGYQEYLQQQPEGDYILEARANIARMRSQVPEDQLEAFDAELHRISEVKRISRTSRPSKAKRISESKRVSQQKRLSQAGRVGAPPPRKSGLGGAIVSVGVLAAIGGSAYAAYSYVDSVRTSVDGVLVSFLGVEDPVLPPAPPPPPPAMVADAPPPGPATEGTAPPGPIYHSTRGPENTPASPALAPAKPGTPVTPARAPTPVTTAPPTAATPAPPTTTAPRPPTPAMATSPTGANVATARTTPPVVPGVTPKPGANKEEDALWALIQESSGDPTKQKAFYTAYRLKYPGSRVDLVAAGLGTLAHSAYEATGRTNPAAWLTEWKDVGSAADVRAATEAVENTGWPLKLTQAKQGGRKALEALRNSTPRPPPAIGEAITAELDRLKGADQTVFNTAVSQARQGQGQPGPLQTYMARPDAWFAANAGQEITSLTEGCFRRATSSRNKRDANYCLSVFAASLSAPNTAELRKLLEAPEFLTPFRDPCPGCSGGNGPVMIAVRGGSFTMGAVNDGDGEGNERPTAAMTVGNFALAQSEVSVGDWRQCSDCDPKLAPARASADAPMTGVSWNDAQTYVRWLSGATGKSYRLPSEAEWEFAARSGGQGAKPKAVADAQKPLGVAETNYQNEWRFIHMLGNVYEMTQDCYQANPSKLPKNGKAASGNCQTQSIRGGAYNQSVKYSRLSRRMEMGKDRAADIVGFRVARDVPDIG